MEKEVDRVLGDEQKRALQEYYLSSRKLLESGVVPAICVQRSFESVMGGVLGEECWRPTHISVGAMAYAVEGLVSDLQRAHGVLEGRKDRYERTLDILSGVEKEFDEWWEYYRHHDATVLITKAEHSSNKKFLEEELVVIPRDGLKLFINSGFSFRFRKKVELQWIKDSLGVS